MTRRIALAILISGWAVVKRALSSSWTPPTLLRSWQA